ncbi:hypothetical protein D9613_002591 [Agrocybe pediades]|uniref:Uncharacterized protein n=1 Tax=Agrocybe pediades TaxID=84607 RepID=A0A8H4QQE3_9AGAR|nr:hypothetical protein D9613_002591 [Agrocybe pediades]
MSRWVLVDDTDSSITYTGPWFSDVGSLDSFGNFGPPYLSTLHGIKAPGAFSYAFKGSRVLITSTIQFPTVGDVTNPSWQCVVDGQLIDSITYTTGENRLRLCEKDDLDDSSHTITVRVDVSNNHTFWLDYIQYLPFPDTPIDTAALSIDTTDPEALLGLMGSWTQKYPGYYTQRNDASFHFQFSGVSLIWLGFYDNGLPMDATTGSYSIDGQAPVSFPLNGIAAKDTGVQYNQVFFQTPKLEAKTHTIEVLYQGDATKAPLSLFVLQIQNGTSPSTTTAPGQSSVSGSTSSISGTGSATHTTTLDVGIKSSKDNTPTLVGGILGGIGLLLVIGILALFILRKRRRRNDMRGTGPTEDPPTAEIIQPFLLNDNHVGSPPTLSPLRPSHQPVAPVPYIIHHSSNSGSSPTQSNNPLSPVRPAYYVIPPRRYANMQGSYPIPEPTTPPFASNSARPEQAVLPIGFDPLPATKHAASSVQSASALTLSYASSSNQEQAGLPRDVDSGLRFPTADSMLPPGYTVL